MPQITAHKTKALAAIEEKMASVEEGSYRYEVLDCCKRFKTSWIELGQALYGVEKDKLYKEWGYITFEGYCQKELGIRHATAVKLLKSYSFLEREEPMFLKRVRLEGVSEKRYPELDSVNLLRLVKAKDHFQGAPYEKLRDKVMEESWEPARVRSEIRAMAPKKEADAAGDEEASKKAFLARALGGLRKILSEAGENDYLSTAAYQGLQRACEAIRKDMERI